MNRRRRSHAREIRHRVLPILEVLLVSVIWGSSFIGVKAALDYAGPLTIAALRYSVAAALLIPFIDWHQVLRFRRHAGLWIRLLAIGLCQYTIGNGALFLALRLIPATSASLALSLCPIPVWVFGAIALRERPNGMQWMGTAAAIGGSFLFFRAGFVAVPPAAIGLLLLAVLSFAVLPVVGRDLSRDRRVSNTALSGIPLAFGGGVLTVIAMLAEGIPQLPAATWGIILGLALVNTLGGYLLFNHALRRIRAGEANVLLTLTPISTAVIAWAAFGERLTVLQLCAMAIVIGGVGVAQRRRTKRDLSRNSGIRE